VFTPFWRRFTDERARDLTDTIALYHEVTSAYRASVWASDDILDRFNTVIAEAVDEEVTLPDSTAILTALDRCQLAVLALETAIFTCPTIDWDHTVLSLKEQIDLRRFLRAQQHFLSNADKVSELLARVLATLVIGILSELPPIPTDDEAASFTIPLYSFITEPGELVDRIIGTIGKPELSEAGLFAELQQTVWQNVCAASGIAPDQEVRRPLVTADKSTLPPEELVETYLKGTPFLEFFLTPIPFALPQAARFEHTHIVAGSGHGKTQLLQRLILDDLTRPDPPALIIIDSQGDMLGKIARLAPFAESDRLILIDPEDERPPALNMFDMATSRLAHYKPLVREQVEAGIIELYNYVFGALAAELTSKQGTAFAFVTRLMLTIPGATIHTLRELMEEDARSLSDSKFADAIGRLDPTAQAFFANQFYNRNAFAQTRQQIARRLYGVLQVPAFDRMLSSPESRLDMFAAMQAGKVVLVNTSKALLKTEASALFGRFMIAQTLRAAYERVAVPEHQRRPAFLVIDEASEYFDDSLETLLNQARKFKLGIVFAHQYLDQLSQSLRASVAANTSIKLAGGVSDRDARSLGPDMRTTADFIAAQRKDARVPPRTTQFACYVRNHTGAAVSLTVPFGSLEAAPTMSERAFAMVLAQNRDRYAVRPALSRPAAPRPVPPSPVEPTTEPVAQRPVTPPQPSADSDDWRS
jgi:hypothetical protein